MSVEIKKRSLAQNKYRFGCVVKTVCDHINEELRRENSDIRVSPEDVDIFIKDKALKMVHRIDTSLGEITVIGRLRNRNTKTFEEAMEQIRAYFALRGIVIPSPHEDIRDLEEQYADNLSRFNQSKPTVRDYEPVYEWKSTDENVTIILPPAHE